MVSDSYNQKKKKSSGIKIPGTAMRGKKRKAIFSIIVETPPISGRDTENEVEEVEDVNPSAKKRKTSKKKSPEKSADTESSTLEKRTMPARKSRKLKIVEEENKEEEETDEENDKMVEFGKRKIL
ncbi:protein PXR1-like [Nicotiana tomentosiformis]|uniref:protein PXR1-like n=1 Tax=Nicotiana tomentosiformis TaxID=4098 RepID=UPI00388C6099